MVKDYSNIHAMSEEDLLYREMNPEDPWYMGSSEDSSLYECDEIDINQLNDRY